MFNPWYTDLHYHDVEEGKKIVHNAEGEEKNSPWKNCFLKGKDSSKLH